MSKIEIRTGDKVRFIPHSYFDLSKFGCLQKHCWEKPESNLNILMIGGQYTIIKRKGYIFREFKLNGGNNWVYSKHFQLSDKTVLCPYKIDDIVIFKPKCSKKELQFLKIANPTLSINSEYKVTNVINEYYIIVNAPFPKEWESYVDRNEIKNESIPLRWIDFEKS